MALWVCGGEAGCGTKYAVGLFRCPRCHNTEFFEDGDPMGKISRHGGASVVPEDAAVAEPVPTEAAAADQPEPAAEDVQGEHGPELVDLPDSGAVFPTAAEEEGGEESSLGSSSSASTEPQPTNSEPSAAPSPKRARTTGSRSKKARTDSDSAPSMAGDQTAPTSGADGSE
jgi:hypothetical protein